MTQGKVRWFDNNKGYGFILADSGEDVFVHYSSIQTEGFKTLLENQSVEFGLMYGHKGMIAENVTLHLSK